METAETSAVRFGVFELDLNSGELRKAGTRTKLQPQPFKVLALLVSRAGEVVTREEIQQQVWGADTFVDFEQGLNFCIKQIRAALDDDADTPRYVETIPKRGYRFLAPISRVEPAGSAAKPEGDKEAPPWPVGELRAVATALFILASLLVLAIYVGHYFDSEPGTEKIMLAVLPFENLTTDPGQEYFSDGMTEELISRLGQMNPNRLGVIARTSVMQYKGTEKSVTDIGRELGVGYLVEGSVRREAGQVRITAQLIQVGDQTHLWTDTFDLDMNSTFLAWDEVASQVGTALAVELLSGSSGQQTRPATSAEANDAYLRGRYFLNKRSAEDVGKARDFFQSAIEFDPEFAPAHAGLADAYSLLGSAGFDAMPPREAMRKARAAARRAVSLDPALAEAHTSLAYETLMYEWDWAAAEKSFRRALALDPNSAETRHWYAYLLAVLNRPEEAVEQGRMALRLDPVSLSVNSGLGWHLYLAGRYDEAVEQLERTLELEPDFAIARFDVGMLFLQLGRTPEAITELREAVRLSERAPLFLAALGTAYAAARREDDARGILAELRERSGQERIPAIYLAGLHAALGETDPAFEWLEKAYQERSNYLIFLNVEPAFRTLHEDPRLEDMLRRIGLPRKNIPQRR